MSPALRPRLRTDAPTTPTTSYQTVSSTSQRILQATNLPTIPPTAAIDPSGNNPDAWTTASQIPTPPENHGMSYSTKVGLAMIPVVVVLVGLYVLFLFWFRKRRAARRDDRPPAPEKDLYASNHSIDTDRRTSKVHNMAAFTTPIYDQNRRAPVYEQHIARNRSVDECNVPVAPLSRPPNVEEDNDSPIDATSPFRLKRGDTVKHLSLGPALARLWPTPPPSVWMRPTNSEEMTPTSTRENSIYQGQGRRTWQ